LVCAYIARRLPDIVPDHAGRRWRFDWLGLALFVLTMGAALVALDRARRFDAAYLPLILGLVALALFAGVTLLDLRSGHCSGRLGEHRKHLFCDFSDWFKY
jgi:hypothetical protein